MEDSMAWSMSEAPTMVTRLDAGPVEYRLEQRGDMSVVVFHGGHVRAGLPLGEEVFAEAGYTLLVPSRPGYGRTPLSTGRSVSGFCDVTRALCAQLGITRIAAVVGTSGGGPTAVTMAARHPDLVQRLILQSAVGWLSYPDRRARLGAHVIFTASTERFTWAAIGALMRRAPDTGLRIMLGGLSTLPVRDVMAALQWLEGGDLVGGGGHLALGEYRAVVVVQRCQQVHQVAVTAEPRSVLPSTAMPRRDVASGAAGRPATRRRWHPPRRRPPVPAPGGWWPRRGPGSGG
jgi:pimeloyl-ACP methyl ester carboxylesterase